MYHTYCWIRQAEACYAHSLRNTGDGVQRFKFNLQVSSQSYSLRQFFFFSWKFIFPASPSSSPAMMRCHCLPFQLLLQLSEPAKDGQRGSLDSQHSLFSFWTASISRLGKEGGNTCTRQNTLYQTGSILS